MEQFITLEDGTRIFVRQWQAKGEVRGHIHVLHGMSEHSGRYAYFAEQLAEVGYHVSAHDHRGHGQTAEANAMPFGYFAAVDGFTQVVRDVEAVTQAINIHTPFILFGHSMGSFIAKRYAQLYPHRLTKLLLCGTGATTALHLVGKQLAKRLASWQGADVPSKWMDKLSFGQFNRTFQPVRTQSDWLAANAEAVDAYRADPYCGFISTNQLYADLLGGMRSGHTKRALQQTPNIPILLISGDKDPVGHYGKDVWKVAKHYVKAGVTNVQVCLVANMRHEILNEKNRANTIAYIQRWLYE